MADQKEDRYSKYTHIFVSEVERTLAMRKYRDTHFRVKTEEVVSGGGTLMKFLPRQAKHKRLRVDGCRVK